MKVGIIGSGGREHAICFALNKSKKIKKIYCFPGNAGTSQIAKNIEGATTLRTFQQNSSSAFRNSTDGNRTEITNSMLTSNGPGHPFTEQ